jgi:DNA-binding NarL/FixJ family response regulator
MSTHRLLVVDDHDIARQGVCALLSGQSGWEVCAEARTSIDGVRIAGELQPDVVIMDLMMPDLNGLDAARQIKKRHPAVEILILTGRADPDLIRSAFDSGIRAYVFKSQARSHLVPAIAALLEGRTYLASGLENATPSSQSADPPLTTREREVLQWLSAGRSNKEVASGLNISIKTVETHRAAIMRKLGLESLSDLVRYAIRKRIVEA